MTIHSEESLILADEIDALHIGQSITRYGHTITRTNDEIETYRVDDDRLCFYDAWKKVAAASTRGGIT